MLSLVSKKQVFSDGTHNAFTSIAHFKGRYFVVFRHASHHNSFDGKTMVISSENGDSWDEPTPLPRLEMDMRDPKLFLWQEKLWCLFPTRWTAEASGDVAGSFTAVCSTEDGDHWTNPTPISRAGVGAWTPKSHAGKLWAPFRGPAEIRLMLSEDALTWREVAPIFTGHFANETDIHFLEDGRLVAVMRRNERKSLLARSSPPYLQWTYDEMDIQLHCPCLRQVGPRLLLAGRDYKRTSSLERRWEYWTQDRVVVLEWDGSAFGNPLELDFRDGGDSAYPGIVPVPDSPNEALVSYYKGTGDKVGYQADIHVARIRVE